MSTHEDLWKDYTKYLRQDARRQGLPASVMVYVRLARDIVLVVFLGVVTYRIALTAVTIDMSNFDFSDLLAMILALFAIGLSAAFYFKANETSNRFYDKVLEFTKDTSELLGRMESGFGERLKHMDEGYVGLKETIGRLPFDRAKAKKEIDEEEAEIQKKENERDDLIQNLLDQAKLQDEERNNFLDDLREKDTELERARAETRRLQDELKSGTPSMLGLSLTAQRYIESKVIPMMKDLGITPKSGLTDITAAYDEITDDLHPVFRGEMNREGLSTGRHLTEKGSVLIDTMIAKGI